MRHTLEEEEDETAWNETRKISIFSYETSIRFLFLDFCSHKQNIRERRDIKVYVGLRIEWLLFNGYNLFEGFRNLFV